MNKRFFGLVAVLVLAIGVVALNNKIHMKQNSVPSASQQAQEIIAAKDVGNPYVIPTVDTIAGSYLSARFAIASDDLAVASQYYQQALGLSSNKAEQDFLYERTLPAALGAGDIDDAVKFASKMDLSKQTATGQLGVLTQIIEGFKTNDSEKISTLLPQMRNDGFGRLLKPLLEAWNAANKKDYGQADAILESLKREYPSLKPLVQMHLAFLNDLQNKNKEAEGYYKNTINDNLSIRSAYLIGQFYERQHETVEIKKLYLLLAAKMPGASLPYIVLNRIEQGKFNEHRFIEKPSDGVAAALYDVATVLHQEGSSRLAILYAQMAHYLAPKDDFTKLLLSDILVTDVVKTQAEDFLKDVSKDSDLYVLAQMRLSQLYQQQENYDAAVVILEKLQNDPLVKTQAAMELGDLYRRKEDFAKAIPYYTAVIDAKSSIVDTDWVLFYSRGMCYERSNQWEKAEADLTRAMELSPRQPEVLNYLAYSWADHGKNLPQALDMLQKALAGAPDDPYITDSVGWALFKNGQAEEAVAYLESAVQELPADAVINGHLGDIYWTVGRKLEANFQWQRALKASKETDKDLRKELEDKLKNGLSDKKDETKNSVAKN